MEQDIKDIEIDIRDDFKNLINDQDALAMALSHLNTSINVLLEDNQKLIRLLKTNPK